MIGTKWHQYEIKMHLSNSNLIFIISRRKLENRCFVIHHIFIIYLKISTVQLTFHSARARDLKAPKDSGWPNNSWLQIPVLNHSKQHFLFLIGSGGSKAAKIAWNYWKLITILQGVVNLTGQNGKIMGQFVGSIKRGVLWCTILPSFTLI